MAECNALAEATKKKAAAEEAERLRKEEEEKKKEEEEANKDSDDDDDEVGVRMHNETGSRGTSAIASRCASAPSPHSLSSLCASAAAAG
jgi:hypothetical protein